MIGESPYYIRYGAGKRKALGTRPGPVGWFAKRGLVAGGEFLEGEGWGKGAGKAFGEAVDGSEETLKEGGDG